MPARKRFKTKYPGVYYIDAKRGGTRRKERIYYMVFRRDGKQIEKKAGHQLKDSMTPAKAARIRAQLIEGKRFTQIEILKQKKSGREKSENPNIAELEKEVAHHKLLEEKWVQFMESATDGFTLCDSKLNVIEVNKAAVDMFPPGTEKKDILGRKLSEIMSDADIRREVEGFQEIIKTGQPRFMGDLAGSPEFGENIHFHV